jgi:phage terminase Nu1 subunit (DNA packaging protein)
MATPLITRRALAESLSVHMQTVTKWEREGLPVAQRGRKGKPSLYDEPAARAWLQARDEAAKGPEGVDLVAARARKEHWQAMLAEQTHQVRAAKLLPAEDVARVWGAEVAAVRTRLLAMPQTLAARLHRAGALHGEAGVERALHDAVREVLVELAGEAQAPVVKRRKVRAA